MLLRRRTPTSTLLPVCPFVGFMWLKSLPFLHLLQLPFYPSLLLSWLLSLGYLVLSWSSRGRTFGSFNFYGFVIKKMMAKWCKEGKPKRKLAICLRSFLTFFPACLLIGFLIESRMHVLLLRQSTILAIWVNKPSVWRKAINQTDKIYVDHNEALNRYIHAYI